MKLVVLANIRGTTRTCKEWMVKILKTLLYGLILGGWLGYAAWCLTWIKHTHAKGAPHHLMAGCPSLFKACGCPLQGGLAILELLFVLVAGRLKRLF